MATLGIANRRARVAEEYVAGRSADEIATELGVSAATVRLDLRAMDVAMLRRGPARRSRKIVFSAAEVAERHFQVAELAGLGKGDHEIGRILGVSKTTIANDRRTLGIPPRPPGQPAKSPLPDERSCETCGKVFRPRRENVKQGGGRFCSTTCMAADMKRRDASRHFVRSLNASRTEKIAALKAQGDLLTRDEAAEELGVAPSSVDHYLRSGYLAAIVVEDVPGQSSRLVRRVDVEQFRLEWLADADGKRLTMRANWLDPAYVVRVYRGRGILERRAREHRLTIEQMAAVVEYDVRQQRRRRIAARRGRPKGSGRPPAYHLEWAEQFEFRRVELRDQYEEQMSLGLLEPGEPPPTDSHAYLAVAEGDFGDHPERWPDYPHAPGDPHAIRRDFAKNAITRVRKAVKALQILETEIR